MTEKDEPTDEQLPTEATFENQDSESVEIQTPAEEVPAEEPETELPKEEFAEPEVIKPESAETGVVEEQESVADLVEMETVDTNPIEPEEAQPEEAQPEEAQPEEAQPEEVQTEEVQTEEVQPEETQPEREEPEMTESEVAEPEREEPEIQEPAEAEPETEEPEIQEPEAAQPEFELSSEGVSSEIPPIHVDYSAYTRQALIDALGLLLSQRTIQEISRDVENIRSTFYRRLNQESDEKLKKFLSEGGSEEEFKPAPDPLEDEFKVLYEQFRVRRSEFSKVLEEEKDINLRKKLHIIDQIKHLLNTQESLNRTFNEFRELQHQWREIGPVPQTELHSLWENYHHHVELFYDYIKINKELRDLDLKKNLEQKIQICESAEELLLEPSVIKAFGELQKMHTQWREIGPVPIEKKDEIWERFREATNQINKKHQDYYLNLKDEQKKNLDAKNHLCDQIDEILKKEVTNPKDWNDLSQEVVNLQRMWRSIGFAPRRDNNKIYDRFRAGCDEFFNRKREYFARHRDDQHENLQLKTDLCVQAESLMSSTEWRKTADELVIIQKKWKEVGPIPRKYSDALWNRFRAACDAFFKRKSEFFSSQDTEQIENLRKKQELIEKVRNFSLTDDHSHDLGILKDIQKEFTSIGHVPLDKKDEVQRDFREGLHKLFNQLDVDEPQKEIIRYKQKVDNFVQSPKNRNRISSEREKLVNKLKQMESDIVLWENNIGFFAKSQKSESLIREVESKILQAKEKVQLLKDKIDMLDRFES